MKTISSKLGRTFGKFQISNIIWFQTTWERELGSKTDNIFTLERKQVKMVIKTFIAAKLCDCVLRQRNTILLTTSFIIQFVPKKKRKASIPFIF